MVEQPGWRTRGHGNIREVRSVIAHHDAARQSPTTFNTVVQNGRPGLPGPLSQFTLRRDGTIHVVAAGVSWHAGQNINDAIYGNYYSLGIEAGNDGLGEPWPDVQINAYVALCGELAKAFGLPVSRIRGHREIAPRRKIDPAGINMNHFRARVRKYINGSGSNAKKPDPVFYDLYNEDFPMRMPKGGKLKPGGAKRLRWEAVTVPSVLREHDLVIGSMSGIHIHTINTWKYITKDNAEQRWGVSSKRPGGVGALMRDGWVHGNAGTSMVIPKGVAVLHIAYATDGDWSLSISPRK